MPANLNSFNQFVVITRIGANTRSGGDGPPCTYPTNTDISRLTLQTPPSTSPAIPMWSFVLRVATFPFAIIWHICKFFWYIWWYYWPRTGQFFPPTPNAPTVLIQPTYHTGVKGPRYPIPPPGSPVPTPPPEPAPEPMPPFPDPTPSKKYLDATPQIERYAVDLVCP